MYKKILILTFLSIIFSIGSTKAITFYDSLNGIAVIPDNHYQYSEDNAFVGHMDMLINKDDYPSDLIQLEVNEIFKNQYPNYDLIEHLNQTEWISYLAFYKDASFMLYDDYEGIHIFAQENNQYEQINHVKVIYFDEDGNTIFTSGVIEILHPKWYESGRGVIFVNIDEQTTTSTYETYVSIFIFLGFVFSLVFAAFLTFIKLVLAIITKLEIVNHPRVFVLNFGLYVILICLMFVLFLTIDWEQNLLLSTLKGVSYASAFIIIEAIIFLALFRKHERILHFTIVYTSVYLIIAVVVGALSLLM